MIIQKDFLLRLKDFGLNSYEAKLWTALLSRGVSTAGELSDIANVPRSRSYDVLESLEKKGFIVVKIGKPIKYIAVPPEEVLERVKKKIKEEADRQDKMLVKLKSSEIITELNLLFKNGIDMVDPNELSGSIKGRNNLYNHLESLIKNANKSVVLQTTEQGLIRKIELLKPVLKKLKEKGVKIKIAAPITKENFKYLKDLSDVAEIRHSTEHSRFCIVDGENLTFMVTDDKEVHPTYDLGIWVNSKFFANALQNYFDGAWKDLKSAEHASKHI
jgi:sugar-specific transcriptional regulator TrmB